jgi:hypothetical protein
MYQDKRRDRRFEIGEEKIFGWSCFAIETDKQHVEVSKIVQGVECRKSKEKEDSLVIQENPNAIGSIVLNICGGNCNITIGKK